MLGEDRQEQVLGEESQGRGQPGRQEELQRERQRGQAGDW